MMEQRAKELGVKTLPYSEARKLLDDLKNQQRRWFDSDYVPKVFKS